MVPVLWVGGLTVASLALGERTGERVAQRVHDSLDADVTIQDTDLRLVRGGMTMTGFAARKDSLGHLAIDIATIECELPPFGAALWDRTCRDLVIDHLRLEVSTLTMFRPRKPKRAPLRVDRVEIRDAKLAFLPTAFAPELGRIDIAVDRVLAGPTTFKTPLSWLFSMRELDATIALPAGISLELRYAGGVLRVRGGIFGSTPVELPVALPVVDAADDAQAETAKLVAFGKQLARQLVERRASDWVRSKLRW